MDKENIKTENSVILSTGQEAKLQEFKGKHVMEAQKIIGTDQSKFLPAVIAQCVTIADKKIVLEDIEEMHGPDYLKLLTLVGENF